MPIYFSNRVLLNNETCGHANYIITPSGFGPLKPKGLAETPKG